MSLVPPLKFVFLGFCSPVSTMNEINLAASSQLLSTCRRKTSFFFFSLSRYLVNEPLSMSQPPSNTPRGRAERKFAKKKKQKMGTIKRLHQRIREAHNENVNKGIMLEKSPCAGLCVVCYG
ncbi:uncharacterized protein EV422DRAFT_381103 [Fimicolochytrium jonesii]|uniref:uncharacterized protein n=1 Tax=Fimicolochytrium jonesii TaxID=1396493 RepID=UPI0022FEED4A|nr:uncharacterized protein EV422DRAFT_381103 [Fimicolochytrium jonesii]KAI8822850.1 hypothetical protein EV422DRAFT_381103 [Fimicolochytrium jonesii]